MLHSLASTSRAGGGEFGSATGQLEFHARSSWIMIRGNRYQVLEEEFFAYVLAPHDAALRDACGVGAAEVASGIQAIATAMREGLNGAIATLDAQMKATYQFATDRGVALDVAIRTLAETDPSGSTAAAGALRDLLRGGLCNLSRHTTLPHSLLQDLAYEVFIRKEGDDVILSPRPRDWRAYLETAPVASDEFMAEVADLPVQER
jgi:virulence-associated protein VagC